MSEPKFIQSVPIVDPKTGLPTQTFLQKVNALLRLLDQVTGDVAGITIPLEAAESALASATGTAYVSARRLAPTRVALADAATVAVDWAASTADYSLTVAGNRVIGNPTNGIAGQYRTIIVQGNDTTDRTITFDTQFLGEVPTITDCDSGVWYALYIHCISSTHFSVSAKKVKG